MRKLLWIACLVGASACASTQVSTVGGQVAVSRGGHVKPVREKSPEPIVARNEAPAPTPARSLLSMR